MIKVLMNKLTAKEAKAFIDLLKLNYFKKKVYRRIKIKDFKNLCALICVLIINLK